MCNHFRPGGPLAKAGIGGAREGLLQQNGIARNHEAFFEALFVCLGDALVG